MTAPKKFDYWPLIERAAFDRGGWLYVANRIGQSRDSFYRYAKSCRYLAGAAKSVLAQINRVKPEGTDAAP